MTLKILPKTLVLTLLSLIGTAALADPAKSSAPLSAQAKIERAVAEKTALARVPGGHIKEGELEQEHGHLVWSFDIARPNSPNVTEVQVDAISGKVVSLKVETPADEAKEAAEDQAKEKNKH